MDVYCSRCGEPWDMDSLHEEAGERYGIPFYLVDESRPSWDRTARTKNLAYDSDAYQKVYQQVRADFQTRGCETLESYGAKCTTPTSDAQQKRAILAGAAYELLGADMDGAAAMLEDWVA